MIRRHRSYATFLDAMLAQLSSPYLSISGERSTLNPLAELDDSTRIGPAQALLEAWAMVGDVLTFYQDRVAAESALSTAREEFSAYAIARLVGYEPRPIISASTWLAFSVSALSGEKPTVTVPRGTAIGNVPSPGKLPAVFETSRDLEADPAWNLVPHALDEVPVRAKLARGATRVVLEGTAPIVPGTALALRVRRAREAAVRLVGAVVAETTVERARDATLLRWQTTTAAEGGEEIVEVLVLDVRVRPFGALAPPFAQAP
ncbi:MAG: hypothetical protein JOZ86_13300, partial [Candidatus Eremiobacteraeota bacterium]|nr:hypothetical protein [Candidatus Eremiobacteraeota bacterium]